jgi:hypothetical protein
MRDTTVADCFRTRIGYTDCFTNPKLKSVADCFRTRIGYTGPRLAKLSAAVADCFRTRIGYTYRRAHVAHFGVADCFRTRIGYTIHAPLEGATQQASDTNCGVLVSPNTPVRGCNRRLFDFCEHPEVLEGLDPHWLVRDVIALRQINPECPLFSSMNGFASNQSRMTPFLPRHVLRIVE